MTKMHFVSAHFGGTPPWFHEIKSNSVEVSNIYYTDNNYPSRYNSMTPRLKSKIPKMLEWQNIEADWYVWIDSSIKLHQNLEDLPRMILDKAGKKPICTFKSSGGDSIREEAYRVIKSIKCKHEYLVKRYSGEPILEQLIHYYGDPEFVDNRLYSTGFFAYNKDAFEMLKDWFHHTVVWSLQCQISFPYILQKHGLQCSLFEGSVNQGNPYFEWNWRKREKNLDK